MAVLRCHNQRSSIVFLDCNEVYRRSANQELSDLFGVSEFASHVQSSTLLLAINHW